MVSLAQLTASVGPALVPIGDAARGRVEISGVHISELPDPTPYLEGGELLLTTGMGLRGGTSIVHDYVARLCARGVRALVFGVGPIHAETPPGLVAACDELGMPLLIVPQQHPFRTITTGYWDLVAAEGHAGLVQQIGTQTSVVREAAGPDGPTAVARIVAQALGSWAATYPFDGGEPGIWPASLSGVLPALAVELRRFAQRGDVGAATFPLHGYDVIAYPIGDGAGVTGAFVVGTTRRLSRTDRQLILTATAALSLRASLAGSTRAAEDAVRAALASLLVADEVTAAQALATAAGVRPLPATVRVFASAPAEEGSRPVPAAAALAELVRRGVVGGAAERPALLATVVDGSLVLLIDGDDDRHGASSGSGSLTGAIGAAVALGSVRAAVTLALRTARRAPLGMIVPAGDSGHATRGDDAAAQLAAYSRAPLVDAAKAYLRHRGSWEHAARELGVHRNTMRARLRTVRDTLGLDLDDPDLAAELWIALRDRDPR